MNQGLAERKLVIEKLTAEVNAEKKKRVSSEVLVAEAEKRLQEKTVTVNKFNIKKYEAKLKSKDDEVAALLFKVKEATTKNDANMKTLEGRLELAQAQVSSLMSTMTTKEAAWRTKANGW